MIAPRIRFGPADGVLLVTGFAPEAFLLVEAFDTDERGSEPESGPVTNVDSDLGVSYTRTWAVGSQATWTHSNKAISKTVGVRLESAGATNQDPVRVRQVEQSEGVSKQVTTGWFQNRKPAGPFTLQRLPTRGVPRSQSTQSIG